MKKILFLTDYADHSPRVFRYALELARHFKASITLAHVYPALVPEVSANFELIDYDPSPDFETQLMDQWDRERERLEYFASDYTPQSFKEIPLIMIVTAGRPLAEVVRLQQEHIYDLTVVGMNTTSSTTHAILGSVALGLIDRSNCPVLLIPPSATYQNINRILFATDLRDDDLPIVNDLLEWTLAFGATLTCLRVIDPEGLSHSKGKEVSELNYQKLKTTVPFQTKRLEVSFIESNEKNFEKNILHSVVTQTADLVVMQTHRRNWWEHLFGKSITKDIAGEVLVPMLVYNE